MTAPERKPPETTEAPSEATQLTGEDIRAFGRAAGRISAASDRQAEAINRLCDQLAKDDDRWAQIQVLLIQVRDLLHPTAAPLSRAVSDPIDPQQLATALAEWHRLAGLKGADQIFTQATFDAVAGHVAQGAAFDEAVCRATAAAGIQFLGARLAYGRQVDGDSAVAIHERAIKFLDELGRGNALSEEEIEDALSIGIDSTQGGK